MTNQPARVRLIVVGDELLEGRTVDTNSRRIQQALGRHAVQVDLIQVVPDRAEAIARALDRTEPGDLVFLCGGLGSTPDDLTREAVAAWAHVELLEDSAARAMIHRRYRRRGLIPRPDVMRQAQVPTGMKPLANPVGSAPGLAGVLAGRHVVMLPGFPDELAGLLPLVVDELEACGSLPQGRLSLLRRCGQVPELEVVDRCRPVSDAHPGLEWSWWVTDWGVDLRVACTGDRQAELDEVAADLDQALGHLVFSDRPLDLPAVVQEMMLTRGVTCGVAESCTGGLIGAALTETPGSSGSFRGGFLVYADEIKTRLLDVPAEMIAREGAVSQEVVRAMAAGCRRKLDCTYALAVSGISGPTGGTKDKPVGTTWVSVATGNGTYAHRYRFPAGRHRNRLLAVAAAVDSLRRVLQYGDDVDPWSKSTAWNAGS